jgi:hypothetical protein
VVDLGRRAAGLVLENHRLPQGFSRFYLIPQGLAFGRAVAKGSV